jgi:glc operon protein GlcG
MLTVALIKQIAARAAEAAAQIPCAMSIAIVDSGANLAYLERMDDAMVGSAETASRKARCAMLFKRPTKSFEDALAAGRMAILSLPDVLPIEGGIPLIRNGEIVGAIGISGGTAPQDGFVATFAAEAFARLP